jgi:hypothetical protein
LGFLTQTDANAQAFLNPWQQLKGLASLPGRIWDDGPAFFIKDMIDASNTNQQLGALGFGRNLSNAAFFELNVIIGGATLPETAGSNQTIAVMGSGRDVAPYASRPGFNVFSPSEGLTPAQLDAMNVAWAKDALKGQTWLVTDPIAHQELMIQLGLASKYIDLELPLVEESTTATVKVAYPNEVSKP